ncbi:hypothetical protein EMCRGX_G021815 [Ephydatia muelleri]
MFGHTISLHGFGFDTLCSSSIQPPPHPTPPTTTPSQQLQRPLADTVVLCTGHFRLSYHIMFDKFVELGVGGSKKKINELYRRRAFASRGKTDQSAAGAAYDALVNQLLTLMDGLNNLLVVGMTNRRELMDSALLRPGREWKDILLGSAWKVFPCEGRSSSAGIRGCLQVSGSNPTANSPEA